MKDKLRELAERWDNYCSDDVGRELAKEECAAELLALLDAEGNGGAVDDAMFDTASKVRDYLNRELPDENKHIFGEVLAALTYAQTHPARSGVVSDEDVRDAERYRHVCENLMTDRNGMFELQQRVEPNTTECYMSKESADEAIDAAIQGERHER